MEGYNLHIENLLRVTAQGSAWNLAPYAKKPIKGSDLMGDGDAESKVTNINEIIERRKLIQVEAEEKRLAGEMAAPIPVDDPPEEPVE